MTVFLKIIELNKSGTILYLLIFHSSLLGSKFVANWCQSELEDLAHVMIVIEVGFLKVLLIYLFLCCSFFYFFLCIFYALEWNHASWRFSFTRLRLGTFKTIDELNDRYLENYNECFIISTFGLCAVVLLFSLGLKIISVGQG